MAREPVSKKLRFEVFKRDKFTCQYCGRAAPDVLLELDHIHPVADGGTNDLLNLITACKDCNAGKGARPLSDSSAITKQKQQLDELQERREQLDLMVQWQRGLLGLEIEIIDQLSGFWGTIAPGYELTVDGAMGLKKLMAKFSVPEILEAMRAAEVYVSYEDDGNATEDSWELAWGKLGGICATKRRAKTNPWIHDCYYIRGVLRNRLNNTVSWRIMQLLEEACSLGIQTDDLFHMASQATSWHKWQDDMQALIDSVPAEEE